MPKTKAKPDCTDKYAYIIILLDGTLLGLEFPYIIGTDSVLEEEPETGTLQFTVIDEELEKTMMSIDRDAMIGYFRREVEEDTDSLPEEVL